jgi:hypothetical protein
VARVKKQISVVGVLFVAWLGLWLTDTGILVWSSDTGVLKTRDCRYLVGVTIAKRLQPLADRCPFIRTVGP